MKPFLLLIALFIQFSLFSQWVEDTAQNTLVADATSSDCQTIGLDNGHTYVVFWKNVPAPENYELRVQQLDEEGNLLFGPEGMLVNTNLPMSTFTVLMSLAVDFNGNLFIGYTSTSTFDGYISAINPSGDYIWGASGVNLGEAIDVKMLPLVDDTVIVSWIGENNQGVFNKFSLVGTPLWAEDVLIEPSNGTNFTSAGELAELGDGSIMILFHDRATSSPSSFLYAMRYDSNGGALWAEPIQVSNQSTAFNRRYQPLLVYGNGVVFGYYGSTGVRFDSFLQRINEDGNLPWGINGSDFDISNTFYEMETSIQAGAGGIYSICRYTDLNQSMSGTYIQKFDPITGARLFTDNAKQVFEISTDNKSPRGSLQMMNVSLTPLFLINQGTDNGAFPTELHAVHLDENGDFIWPEQTQPVATHAASKGRIAFTKNVLYQSVAVFVEERASTGNEPRIYAQNVKDVNLNLADVVYQGVKFHPNPVKNYLQIECPFTISEIEVFDLKGALVITEVGNNQEQATLDTSGLKNGIYLGKLTANQTVFSFKFVKN